MISRAEAAGYPSSLLTIADGVPPFLVDRQQKREKTGAIIAASLNFNTIIEEAEGTEEEKVMTARLSFPDMFAPPSLAVGDFLSMVRMENGGENPGVLSKIFEFL